MDIKMKGCLVFLVLLFITIGAVSATDVSDDSTVVADDVPTAYSTEEAISYETSTSSDSSPDTSTTINDNSVVTVGDNEVIDGNGSTFTNTSFKVTGNNVVLSNFCVDNNDFASSVIDATGVNNLTIANVCLTTTNTDGVTFGIDFTNTTNSIIRDSTITVNAPSQAQIWKNDTGYWYSTLPVSAILLDGSQNIAVTQNTIGITNTTESCQGTTMPAVTVKNNAQNINITNNDISACGASYVYGVMMNDVVSNVKVLNNNVTVTGPLYVAGVDASTSTQSTVSSNKISVSSSNPTGIYYNGTESLAYGVILATYATGNSQNTVNGNNISLTGNVAYGIENIYGTDNNINNNQITINAKRGLGIATHTSNNNHYDNNNIVINCNQDSINNFYEMITPQNVGIIIINSSNNQINNNYILINETNTTNTTYAIILDENSTDNMGSNNDLTVRNLTDITKEGINAILDEGFNSVTTISKQTLLKKSLKDVKESNEIIINDENLNDYAKIHPDNLSFEFGSVTEDTDLIINLTDKYSKYDLNFLWLIFDSYKLNIQVLSEHTGITLMSFMNPVTVHDSILPKTMIASNNMGYFKDSVFLDVDNTGSFVGGHFDNVTFIADNENIEVLSYKQSGNPDMCNKQYSDFFESNNVLLDSVNSGTTIIIRHPGINKYSEPIIINKPVNLTGVFDATWSGDITFVSGSEGSNLTDMTLNGTVYINTTNIGLYNNTVNKGVVIKDSADNIIVDNTFNTEDVAITLVNTIQTNIQNNDITSQAEYAIALDDDSIENTITKNIIYSADKEGNDAVNGDTTTNTISANKPGPVIFTLTDSTWSEFFNDDGTAKDIVEAGAELRFDGVFNNRDMVISVPLNLTTADTQAVLNNCSFFIDADGVNVTNIQMNADDIEGSLIYVEDAEDTRIENNTLTLTNNGEKVVTHTINVIESSNVIIRNNTITTTGPEEDVVYDGFQTTLVYTTSIYSELTDSVVIENNNIKTKGNGKSTETGTIYGVYVSGEYIYDDEYYIEFTKITDNTVYTEAAQYAYGINVGHATTGLVTGNNVTSVGGYYADAIQGYNVYEFEFTDNTVNVTSDNMAYGIIAEGFFYVDDDYNMDWPTVEDNIIASNEITLKGKDAWAVEIVIGTENTVEYNNITIEASNGVGVGIADCDATVIENNNIDITATQESGINNGDAVDSYTTGVKITPSNSRIKSPHENNVTFNNITINAVNNDVAAVNLTSNDNTITDNYLLSPAGRGDKAVADTGEDNTIENNIPDYRLTDDTYSFYFDENGILNEEYNNTEIPIYGDFTENTQFIFEGVNVTIKADDFATLHDSQIITGNGATVVLDGITIMNKDMDAIYFESNGNVIKNSIIFVNSSMPLHLIEFAGDENTITNCIITAYIPSADVAYDKDYVGLPQSSALYISSNNNTVENVGVIVNGAEVAEGSYYPSIDAIDIQSTGKGVVIEGNTLRNVTVIATGSNYVYGINVGRAKDTTIENVDIDVESDYYTNGIQLFDAVDITIDGTIDSTADTQAYGVYATAMAVGTSSGIDLTGLNITVESPDATGVLIEGASDVIIADATYDINGGNATAVNAHVDWMGNIPENIIITGMDINIDGTEDNSILYFGLCDGVIITDCNIETTSGSEINFNKTSDAQVINNYILIKDMMTGSFGNYAVITTENDTTVENNTPTSKLIDELNQQIEDLQNELDQLKAPKATTLTLDPVTDAKYNTNITITGTLVNEDSIGLFNQVVTLTIGDKTVDVTTKGGVFEYTTSFKTLEEQTVTATYAGTDKYNASEDTITFTLEKGDVIVTVDEIAEIAYGDNVTITGKFTTSDGKAISNSNVKITIDGKKYYAKTDKTGTYTLSVKASTVGENTITAGYSGNANYNAYETTATFNVKAADAVVTYEPISDVTLGENVTITGTFTDANGKAVTSSNVKITINGKKYYAKTDSTGKYTLSVATTKEGVNNVTIGYSGSAKYNAFETSTTFTVLKAQ